jgi:hypothetical protein
MPLISEQRLIRLALDALEEAAAAAHHAPVFRTWGIRLALAYLASRERHGGSGARWPFDQFWKYLPEQKQQDRWANLNAALNAVYLSVGEKRDWQRVTLFEQRSRR